MNPISEAAKTVLCVILLCVFFFLEVSGETCHKVYAQFMVGWEKVK